MNKSAGGLGRADIPIYGAQCRWLRDTRGLHSGEWFIREGERQARRANATAAGCLVVAPLLLFLLEVVR